MGEVIDRVAVGAVGGAQRCLDGRRLSGELGESAVAAKIFDGLRAEGRWPVVYIDDVQKVLDRFEPA